MNFHPQNTGVAENSEDTDHELFDVAVVIVTYNSQDEIEDCIASVISEARTVKQQIIVLDNKSKDETASIIRSKFPDVLLLEPGKNLGFAKGVNEAARHAQSRHILLLNPDTKILNNAIDSIVQFAEANPGHGLYGGRTVQPDGTLEPSSCWGLPTLWSLFTFALGLSTIFRKNPIFDPESLGKWQRDSVREVGVITGCFLLVRKDFWNDRLNGFDERYFMYGEDVDLAMRSRALGCSPVVCPDAEIVHEVGKSSKTPTHKMMLLFKGKACLVRTHWEGPKLRLALGFLQLGVFLRALPSIIRRERHPEGWHAIWERRNEWIVGYDQEAEDRQTNLDS